MIGSYVVKGLKEKGHTVIGVDRVLPKAELRAKGEELREDVVLDLSNKEAIGKLFDTHKIDRVIHLAALAHTAGMKNLTWEVYHKINVECAENVFEACAAHNVPVLFISTVDAIGMVKGPITPETPLNPISYYGKSKAMAEGRLKEIWDDWNNRANESDSPAGMNATEHSQQTFGYNRNDHANGSDSPADMDATEHNQQTFGYNIYRFSPVYAEDVKRDIQKRYYLKYPDWAYLIGGGQQFEVLAVKKAVAAMVDWVDSPVDNTIHIIKDEELLDSAQVIAEEKAEGRARHVLRIPRWMVVCGYHCLRLVFGKSNKTYLVFKALWPFRTSD